jgi:hypothetical protein
MKPVPLNVIVCEPEPATRLPGEMELMLGDGFEGAEVGCDPPELELSPPQPERRRLKKTRREPRHKAGPACIREWRITRVSKEKIQSERRSDLEWLYISRSLRVFKRINSSRNQEASRNNAAVILNSVNSLVSYRRSVPNPQVGTEIALCR